MNDKIKWIEPQQRFAFCALSVIPLRKEAKDSAEQVSQMLFGEPLEVLEYTKPWLKVRGFLDGYEGYIDHKQVIALTDKELKRWMDSYIIANAHYIQVNGPLGHQFISGGSFVGNQAEFQIGNYAFQRMTELTTTNAWSYALGFLNTPYLWGGKSIFGIDCSGLVQNVYRLLDINLPRDANQQVEIGMAVNFEDRQALDLAFFKNQAGRIHHVGIIGPDLQILHASGQVRLDKLTEEGIYNDAAQDFTHSLHEIRRLF
jgi:cell wall-associated NlpC family hydrolase